MSPWLRAWYLLIVATVTSVSIGVSYLSALVVGNGSLYTVALRLGYDIPFSLSNLGQAFGLVYLKILLFAFKEYSFHEKLMKNMGPHCTVRLRALAVAFLVAWTLEPIKSLCTISTIRLVFLCDDLTQSPFEAVPLDLHWEGPGVQLLMDRQSVALWEEDI